MHPRAVGGYAVPVYYPSPDYTPVPVPVSWQASSYPGGAGGSPAAAGQSVITVVNTSGQHLVARLVGPSRRQIGLNTGKSGSIRHVTAGTYAIVARLGEKGNYTYGRTEDFDLPASAEMTVTIGRVENNGEAVRGSSEEEFNAAK